MEIHISPCSILTKHEVGQSNLQWPADRIEVKKLEGTKLEIKLIYEFESDLMVNEVIEDINLGNHHIRIARKG